MLSPMLVFEYRLAPDGLPVSYPLLISSGCRGDYQTSLTFDVSLDPPPYGRAMEEQPVQVPGT